MMRRPISNTSSSPAFLPTEPRRATGVRGFFAPVSYTHLCRLLVLVVLFFLMNRKGTSIKVGCPLAVAVDASGICLRSGRFRQLGKVSFGQRAALAADAELQARTRNCLLAASKSFGKLFIGEM